MAKAKGLPKSKIIGKHALKNAMSSIITILGMQFASLLGGSVITEQVFAWPGGDVWSSRASPPATLRWWSASSF